MFAGIGYQELLVISAIALIPLFLILNACRKETPTRVGSTGSDSGLAVRIFALYMQPFQKFATFNGRSTLREYWTFSLISMPIAYILQSIDHAIGWTMPLSLNGPLWGIFVVATLLPTLAVTARRLHDTNRSGWWLLLHGIPFLGWLLMLYQLLGRGTPGDNRYGADPRAEFDDHLRLTTASESA